MLNILKSSAITLVLLFASTSVFALPPTTIERVYFATADKEDIVGYLYLGCVVTSHASWGTNTPYYENIGVRNDCTQLGEVGGDYDGLCVINGISDQMRNSGQLSYSNFLNIKASC